MTVGHHGDLTLHVGAIIADGEKIHVKALPAPRNNMEKGVA
jgi:hypothetical protein